MKQMKPMGFAVTGMEYTRLVWRFAGAFEILKASAEYFCVS